MSSVRGPNPIKVAWSVLRVQATKRPAPFGTARLDHSDLAPVLGAVAAEGVGTLPDLRGDIEQYRKLLEDVDPDMLSRDEAMAYWLNLYNAGALHLAAETVISGEPTVLRVPGGFQRAWAIVGGEELSLDAIEHGKIRRLGDPRIHGALVCGSASCPTLRATPYTGAAIGVELDDQLRSFLARGGAGLGRDGRLLRLSRVFLWYGADFARPHRMPTWIPAGGKKVARALTPWLSTDIATALADERLVVDFQPYDWTLACSVT